MKIKNSNINQKIRYLFISILFINTFLMILIGHIIVGTIFAILFGVNYYYEIKKKTFNKKSEINISDDIAEAMAGKITFEAQQLRKRKDKYNYMKIKFWEKE